jgi:hypothetical protein
MATFQTSDQNEAHRFELALQRGKDVTAVISGAPVTGKVQSVQVDESASPKVWTIMVLPK